jgi:hypothetical protein
LAASAAPRRALEVDAQELLLLADHAQLHVVSNCGSRCSEALTRSPRAGARASVPPRRADHREQTAGGAERGHVARDVGRTPRTLLGAPHVHHRHRRLGEMRLTSPNQ